MAGVEHGDASTATLEEYGDEPLSAAAGIADAMVTQARVVKALVLRETLSRYGQHKLGFLWAPLEQVIVISVFVAMLSAIRADNPGGMPLVLFMITGFVPFTLFRDPMNQMQGAIATNRNLLGFPQVTTFDLALARGILECSVVMVVFPCLLFLAHVLGYEVRVENPLGVLAACLLLAALGCGAGFLFATLTPMIPSIRQLTAAVFGRPLFFASGLFYTADAIPEPVRGWLLYNPVLHLMELLRSEFFREFESPYGDWRYASLWAIGTLAFGLLAHQALRRRAIVGI